MKTILFLFLFPMLAMAPPSNETLSSIIQIKLFRLGAGDPNNDDARLLEYDIHYQKDTFGSQAETAK